MNVQASELSMGARHWRRVTRHPALMEYRRLNFLVAIVNIAVFANGWLNQASAAEQGYALQSIADMALINLSIAILIRQQRVINALFWLATRIPTTWPLWIRWGAGKVFHFGGLHSASAVAGSAWFGFMLWAMVANRLNGASAPSNLTLASSALMLGLMVAMIVSAMAPMRQRFHDVFEQVHRIAGWSVLILFWIQTVSIVSDFHGDLLHSPAFWMLCLLTLSIASPWLTLKKVDVNIVRPSQHVALTRFDYGDTPFSGSSNAISLTPFGQYHAFANVPTPGQAGYRLVISRAGDWTGRFIDNPPDKVWVKGITTSGVARIEVLFRRVVYVGTGSGIGPILPHLFEGRVPCRLIWSTRSPRNTYGDALVDEILAHTDSPLIWDTNERGKPDLTMLALQAVRETSAEAVIVISNQKLTRRVVHDLESLGIPAFGAIWDS